MIKKYHKIDSVYERGDRGRFTDKFARPEFEYLFNNTWVGTEKFHGVNMRMGLKHDGHLVKDIRGRTDDAQIPPHLLTKMNDLAHSEKFQQWTWSQPIAVHNITLYGEGFGHKIQKEGKLYLGDEVDFILFDVLIDGWWLKREAVDDVANKLGIRSVPVIFEGTLGEAIEKVKDGFDSTIGSARAEGLVLTPKVDLHCRNGERIITKLKEKDFRHLKR